MDLILSSSSPLQLELKLLRLLWHFFKLDGQDLVALDSIAYYYVFGNHQKLVRYHDADADDDECCFTFGIRLSVGRSVCLFANLI